MTVRAKRKTLDSIAESFATDAAKLRETVELHAARADAAESDLQIVLDFISRQGGYLSGEDRVLLMGLRARVAARRETFHVKAGGE